MKPGISRTLCALSALAVALPLTAGQPQVETFKTELKSVRAAEMPARAASIVSTARGEREVVAADVVTAAVAVSPVSTPIVVSSIARVAPETAATTAAAAATAQPKMISGITRAAVAAAPSEVQGIVTAVTKAQPTSFFAIGVAAADVAPKSSEEILRGVSAALPALKTLLTQAGTDAAAVKRSTSVPWVLKRAESLLAALAKSMNSSSDAILAHTVTAELSTKLASLATTVAPPPVIGPPYTPRSGSGGEIIAVTETEVNPVGRDYSAP